MKPIIGTRYPIRCFNCSTIVAWQLKTNHIALTQKYWCTGCMKALETLRVSVMGKDEERRQIFYELNTSDRLLGREYYLLVINWMRQLGFPR